MKKIILILIILFSISSVNADTQIPNANTTGIFTYDNNTVDAHYYFNSTDSITKIKISYNLLNNNEPFTYTMQFKDKRNNTLVVSDLYTYNNYFGVVPYITKTRTSYLNNIPQLFQTSDLLLIVNSSYQTGYNYSERFNLINYLSDSNSFNDKIEFSNNKIIFDKSSWDSNIYENRLNTNIYVNEIILPNSSRIEYTNINIEYKDNSVIFINAEINSAYDSMNPVFKFIFLFFKGITTFLSWTSVITDAEMYNYQYVFISPLSYIDYAIKLFFSMLKFISTMGLLWLFVVIECIIFVVNWIRTGDIIDTITNSLSDSKSIWEVLLIKPLNWIYTKLMLFWTSK